MTALPSRTRTVTWSDPAAAAAAGAHSAGIDFLRDLIAGTAPPPPIIALLGITLVSAEPGEVVMRLDPGEHLYNPIGSVHGGAIATILDSVMGCAVHSTLARGQGYTTLEIKVNYLRAVTTDTGPTRAVGRVVHGGRRQAMAEGQLFDGRERLLAVASTTCLVFDRRPEAGVP